MILLTIYNDNYLWKNFYYKLYFYSCPTPIIAVYVLLSLLFSILRFHFILFFSIFSLILLLFSLFFMLFRLNILFFILFLVLFLYIYIY